MVSTNRTQYQHETERIRQQLWALGNPPAARGQSMADERQTLSSGALMPNGSHNRTQRQLHLDVGLSIAYAYSKRRQLRRAWGEWRDLFIMHAPRPVALLRLLRHLPMLAWTAVTAPKAIS